MNILQTTGTVLSFESVRWILIVTFALRLISVSIINHLTWKKLLSLTVMNLISGPLVIAGVAWLDMLIPEIEFRGYPEVFISLFFIDLLLAQLLAKLILVSIDWQLRHYHKIRNARVVLLQIKATRFTEADLLRHVNPRGR